VNFVGPKEPINLNNEGLEFYDTEFGQWESNYQLFHEKDPAFEFMSMRFCSTLKPNNFTMRSSFNNGISFFFNIRLKDQYKVQNEYDDVIDDHYYNFDCFLIILRKGPSTAVQ
jgi:hypothetical protein